MQQSLYAENMAIYFHMKAQNIPIIYSRRFRYNIEAGGDKMIDIRERLQKLMAERNLTIYSLAKKSSLSWHALKSLFDGTPNPTLSTLSMLCDGLGISLAQLFEEDAATFGRSARPSARRPAQSRHGQHIRMEQSSKIYAGFNFMMADGPAGLHITPGCRVSLCDHALLLMQGKITR